MALAMNRCLHRLLCPQVLLPTFGESEMEMLLETVTLALADLGESASLVALTCTATKIDGCRIHCIGGGVTEPAPPPLAALSPRTHREERDCLPGAAAMIREDVRTVP
jgi:hypothetical protein